MENKFKLWDKNNKRWVSSENFLVNANGDIYGVSYGFTQNRIVKLNNDDFVICHYIGLRFEVKDNMENVYEYEIYEGDIVTGNDSLNTDVTIWGCVDFQDGSFVIKNPYITHFRWMDYDVKTIGNIYENPLLMQHVEDEIHAEE